MTPEQRLIAKWIAILLCLTGVFFSGFGVRGYMADKADLAAKVKQQDKHIKEQNAYAQKFGELTQAFNKIQSDLTLIDANHQKVLNEKLTENSMLRRDLAVARRMQLFGTTCPAGSAETADAAASLVGDGAGLKLSEETRSLVWDLRGDIISDQAKLTYLHEYIRKLELSPK